MSREGSEKLQYIPGNPEGYDHALAVCIPREDWEGPKLSLLADFKPLCK